MDLVTKTVSATVGPVDDSENPYGEFDVILSTDALDRDGEYLRPEEWKQPLPARITFDSDHGMSVATTVGSGKPFINEAGQLQVRGLFASTAHAQNVRTLVNEGHITSTSVAFRQSKNTKGEGVQRELLNGAFVAVPANPEAAVLSSKADKNPYGDVTYADPGYQDDGKARYPIDTEEHVRAAWSYVNQEANAAKYSADELSKVKARIRSAAKKFGIEISDDSKSFADDVVTKQAAAASSALQDRLQAIHDYAVDLGAMCSDTEPDADDTTKTFSAKDYPFFADLIARKLAPESSSRQAGPPMESTEESTAPAAAAACKAAAAGAADESAESVALRGRALALTLATKVAGADTDSRKET